MLGVWQRHARRPHEYTYAEKHPATFPEALAEHAIRLFTHPGELVVDPFAGVGTTLVAASALQRPSFGVDLNPEYVKVAEERLSASSSQAMLFGEYGEARVVCDNATNIGSYLDAKTVKLVFTSPPYANLLDRVQKSAGWATSKDGRVARFHEKLSRYSDHPDDIGLASVEVFREKMATIFSSLEPAMRDDGQVLVNITATWQNKRRQHLPWYVVEALEKVGYVLQNILVWDKRSDMGKIGIYGYPRRFIQLGSAFECLLHFVTERFDNGVQ